MWFSSFFGKRSKIKQPVNEISAISPSDSFFLFVSVAGARQFFIDAVRIVKGEPLYCYGNYVRFGEHKYRQDSWHPEVQTIDMFFQLGAYFYLTSSYHVIPDGKWLAMEANAGLNLAVTKVTEGAKWLLAQKESYRLGLSSDDFSKFSKNVQVSAYESGVSFDNALRFENFAQLQAYKLGVPFDDALRFQNFDQVLAYESGASIDVAVKFDNHIQVSAFQAGASADNALKFESYAQIDALELGLPIDDALKFKNSMQVNAYKAGVSVDESIDFNSDTPLSNSNAYNYNSPDTMLGENYVDL